MEDTKLEKCEKKLESEEVETPVSIKECVLPGEEREGWN